MQVRPLLPAPAKSAGLSGAFFVAFLSKKRSCGADGKRGREAVPLYSICLLRTCGKSLKRHSRTSGGARKLLISKQIKKQHDTNKKYGQNRIFVISLPKVDICTSFILKIIRVNPCLYIEYTKEKEAFYEAHFQKVHRTSPDLLHGVGHDPHGDPCRRQHYDADAGT